MLCGFILHPIPCRLCFLSHSRQTNSPACIRFLFKVLGETSGFVPAFVSTGNQIQMNVGVSIGWKKKPQDDSQGVATGAEGE